MKKTLLTIIACYVIYAWITDTPTTNNSYTTRVEVPQEDTVDITYTPTSFEEGKEEELPSVEERVTKIFTNIFTIFNPITYHGNPNLAVESEICSMRWNKTTAELRSLGTEAIRSFYNNMDSTSWNKITAEMKSHGLETSLFYYDMDYWCSGQDCANIQFNDVRIYNQKDKKAFVKVETNDTEKKIHYYLDMVYERDNWYVDNISCEYYPKNNDYVYYHKNIMTEMEEFIDTYKFLNDISTEDDQKQEAESSSPSLSEEESSDEQLPSVEARVTEIFTNVFSAYNPELYQGNSDEAEESLICSEDWNKISAELGSLGTDTVMCFYDSDYWCNGQDYDNVHFDNVKLVKQKGKRAIVSIDTYNFNQKTPRILKMVYERGNWYIDNMICSEYKYSEEKGYTLYTITNIKKNMINFVNAYK